MGEPKSAAKALPPLDNEIVRELQSLDSEGDEGFFLHLVREFREEGVSLVRAMQSAIRAGDAGKLRDASHTLKGAAASIGAARLADLCREAEILGREGNLTPAPGLVPRLQEEWKAVQIELQRLLGD